nr:hypothetical protein [Planctomycetota bacterium]
MDDVPPAARDDPPARARRSGPRWLQRLDKSPVQRGLTLASIDGAVIGVMAVVIEVWLVPLLQHRLGASAQAIGLLTIVPMLTASVLGPIVAPIIAALGGNKRALLATIVIQILALALLSLPIHAPDSAWSLPTALTLCIAIASCGAIGNPAWLAWMSDLIPPRIRGRYSSGRMRLYGVVRLVSAVVFMLIMQRWLPEDSAVGLQILLALGFSSRL